MIDASKSQSFPSWLKQKFIYRFSFIESNLLELKQIWKVKEKDIRTSCLFQQVIYTDVNQNDS